MSWLASLMYLTCSNALVSRATSFADMSTFDVNGLL
jgi:hypothetical protein